jgi:small nuclear ribonucleoprotein (snRNP)-like protein
MRKILFHLKSLLTLLTLVTLISMVTASAQVASQGGMPTAQQGAVQRDQDNDTTRGELASFDRFMDSHPEIAEQLRKDPSLVKNGDFVRNHRDLQEYLQQHPGVSEEISENPARFMHQEQRFDRAEDRRNGDRRDDDATRGELASFDRFMDSHREIAEQLRKDPSLVKNEDFVRNHRDLQEYLQQHPGVREEISENPDRFMRQEQRFDRAEDQRNGDRRDNDRRDNDTTRGELASFDQFMDGHREIAEQLRKDPSLVKNEDFVRNHRDLQEYLQQHPGVREEISENPDRFMHQEQRFDRAEDQRNNYRPDPDNDRRDNDRRDNDTTRGELASFDRFSDSHPEIAEQLRRDPSLVRNDEFVEKHPALQEYLQQHPGVREEISENPDRFMRQEQRFDRHEDRDHDMARGELETFGQFLGNHSSIAQDLSRNPSLANSEEYQKTHPDFQQYLQTHPGVQAQLKQNPQVFVKSAQPAQPMGTSPTVVPKAPTTIEPMPKPPTVDPIPKQ